MNPFGQGIQRRHILALTGTAVLTGGSRAMAQSAWPSRAVRIVNPYPPGSPVDVVGRHAADALQRAIGQAFTVESVTGAGGTIGVGTVARAAADGYTLLTQQSAALINGPHLYKGISYSVMRDLRPLWALQSPGLVMVINPKSPYKNLRELIEAAKASPGKLSFSTAGAGSPQHMGAALLMREAGIELLHVPYRGAVPAQVALMGGEVDLLFDSISGGMAHILGGNMRGLVVTRESRFVGLPDVPTGQEAGMPTLRLPISVIGLYAPAAMARDVSEKIAYELNKAWQADSTARERMNKLGLADPLWGDALLKHMTNENDFYGKLIKDARITIET